jgi:hypothetical protein
LTSGYIRDAEANTPWNEWEPQVLFNRLSESEPGKLLGRRLGARQVPALERPAEDLVVALGAAQIPVETNLILSLDCGKVASAAWPTR